MLKNQRIVAIAEKEAVVGNMVKEIVKAKKRYFTCELCDMVYANRKIAEDCEARCKEGKPCHNDMIRKSLRF